MKLKRMAALLLSAAMVAGLAGCGDAASESTPAGAPTEAVAAPETAAPTVTESAAASEAAASSAPEEQQVDYNALVQGYDVDFDALSFDGGAWSYDADNNVYYQIGVRYCAQPAAEDYETLAVVVPGVGAGVSPPRHCLSSPSDTGRYSASPSVWAVRITRMLASMVCPSAVSNASPDAVWSGVWTISVKRR